MVHPTHSSTMQDPLRLVRLPVQVYIGIQLTRVAEDSNDHRRQSDWWTRRAWWCHHQKETGSGLCCHRSIWLIGLSIRGTKRVHQLPLVPVEFVGRDRMYKRRYRNTSTLALYLSHPLEWLLKAKARALPQPGRSQGGGYTCVTTALAISFLPEPSALPSESSPCIAASGICEGSNASCSCPLSIGRRCGGQHQASTGNEARNPVSGYFLFLGFILWAM